MLNNLVFLVLTLLHFHFLRAARAFGNISWPVSPASAESVLQPANNWHRKVMEVVWGDPGMKHRLQLFPSLPAQSLSHVAIWHTVLCQLSPSHAEVGDLVPVARLLYQGKRELSRWKNQARRQQIKPTRCKNALLKHGDTAGAAFPSKPDWSILSTAAAMHSPVRFLLRQRHSERLGG